MPIEITMPALGPNVEAGNLSRWLVKVGQKIKQGEAIAEIETDKATMEVESTGEGVLAKLLVADGTEQVKVGAVIALLTKEGEALGAAPAAAPAAAPPAVAQKPAASAPPSAAQKSDDTAARPAAAAVQAPAVIHTDNRRIKASPLARRLARAQGIDLSTVKGSGPSGRIVKVDVDNIASRAPAPAAQAAAPTSVYGPPADVPHETIKLSTMRKVIARRLAESKATVPHFYLTVDIALDALLKLRSEFNAALGTKLSVNDLLIKALALALRQVPDANVQFAGEQLYKFSRADVSVAVAIPGGLITPVVRDAGGKHLTLIAAEMTDLVARAREGKLAPHEYQGGTASLSNLGMFGIKQFDAVINPPQALIVAVGAGEKRAVVNGDAVQIATIMSATGSFDHRAVDGAVGAQFMAALKRIVEKPLNLLA